MELKDIAGKLELTAEDMGLNIEFEIDTHDIIALAPLEMGETPEEYPERDPLTFDGSRNAFTLGRIMPVSGNYIQTQKTNSSTYLMPEKNLDSGAHRILEHLTEM